MTTTQKPIRPLSLGRHLIFTAGATLAMCNKMLEAYDLTLPQWVVLAALWQHDNLTVGAISDYCGTNIPATSRLVDRMVEKGLVSRAADAIDRRTVRISLTDSSEGLRHLNGFHDRVNSLLLRGISPSEADQLFDLLMRVEKNAERQD